MSEKPIVQLIHREITPELYDQIRKEWQTHSIAEDQRDIAGLMSTLTDDCVYEYVQTGKTWCRHEGATRFYTELLTAFPDLHFDLQQIVIGPQGVFEEAVATGTHKGDWQDIPASGQHVRFNVLILFPGDQEKQKFKGERIYMFNLEAGGAF